jgi:glycosyltransferase involved in cell wall biosynthesis
MDDLTFRAPCIVSVFLLIYFQRDATLHSLFISGKLLCMFRVVTPPIIRNTHNCIYNIWYLSNRFCYLPLLWKSWNWFEYCVGIVLICAVATAPKHKTAQQRQVAITVWQVPDAVDTVVCAPDDGWRHHPKHVELLPDINKLCKLASCWIYIEISHWS